MVFYFSFFWSFISAILVSLRLQVLSSGFFRWFMALYIHSKYCCSSFWHIPNAKAIWINKNISQLCSNSFGQLRSLIHKWRLFFKKLASTCWRDARSTRIDMPKALWSKGKRNCRDIRGMGIQTRKINSIWKEVWIITYVSFHWCDPSSLQNPLPHTHKLNSSIQPAKKGIRED